MAKKNFTGDFSGLIPIQGKGKNSLSEKDTTKQESNTQPKESVVKNKTPYSLRLYTDDLKKLQAIAKIEGVTVQKIISKAIRKEIRFYESKKGEIDTSVIEKKSDLYD